MLSQIKISRDLSDKLSTAFRRKSYEFMAKSFSDWSSKNKALDHMWIVERLYKA